MSTPEDNPADDVQPTEEEWMKYEMERAASMNTDRTIWREVAGDYYSPSIHVTAGGGIGINVGGTVIVKTLAEWHSLAGGGHTDPRSPPMPSGPTTRAAEARRLSEAASPGPWFVGNLDFIVETDGNVEIGQVECLMSEWRHNAVLFAAARTLLPALATDVTTLAERLAEAEAGWDELRQMKLAFEQTPKQWSTAQAPTMEAVVATARQIETEEKNRNLSERLASVTAELKQIFAFAGHVKMGRTVGEVCNGVIRAHDEICELKESNRTLSATVERLTQRVRELERGVWGTIGRLSGSDIQVIQDVVRGLDELVRRDTVLATPEPPAKEPA